MLCFRTCYIELLAMVLIFLVHGTMFYFIVCCSNLKTLFLKICCEIVHIFSVVMLYSYSCEEQSSTVIVLKYLGMHV